MRALALLLLLHGPARADVKKILLAPTDLDFKAFVSSAAARGIYFLPVDYSSGPVNGWLSYDSSSGRMTVTLFETPEPPVHKVRLGREGWIPEHKPVKDFAAAWAILSSMLPPPRHGDAPVANPTKPRKKR